MFLFTIIIILFLKFTIFSNFRFDDDGAVAAQIRSIFETDFKEPHANYSQTPEYIIERWYKTFAVSFLNFIKFIFIINNNIFYAFNFLFFLL